MHEIERIKTLRKSMAVDRPVPVAAFREWFLAYENARWDQQIEEDSESGKLDSRVDEARAAHRAGKSTPL